MLDHLSQVPFAMLVCGWRRGTVWLPVPRRPQTAGGRVNVQWRRGTKIEGAATATPEEGQTMIGNRDSGPRK